MPFSGPLDNQCPEFSKPTGDGNNVRRMGPNCLTAQLQVRSYSVHPDGEVQTIGRNETRGFPIAALYPGNRQTQKKKKPSDNHRKVKTSRQFRRRCRVILIFASHVSPIAHERLLLIGPGCSILSFSIQLRTSSRSCRCLSLSNFNSFRISI